jgi:hypothetical protein
MGKCRTAPQLLVLFWLLVPDLIFVEYRMERIDTAC